MILGTNQPTISQKSPLILVADDDEAIRLLLRIRLEREGYRVQEAADGKEAIAVYEQARPDMILLDHMMPETDGITVCARIRRLPGGASTPILIITALDDGPTVDLAFEAGATDYVTKPITWPVLRHRVRRLLQIKETSESLALLERAIVAASNGIIITDASKAEHPIIYVNPAFERITGYDPQTVIGLNCMLLYGPETEQAVTQRITRALEAGEACHVVLKNYRKDGEVFWNELTLSPVRDATGQVSHFIWVHQDISRRIQREEERLSQLSFEMALVTVIKELNSTTELEAVLHTALEQALRASHLPCGAIYLYDDQSGDLLLRAQHGIPDHFLAQAQRLPRGWGISGQVAATGKLHVVEDVEQEHPDLASLAAGAGLHAQLSLPLRAAGELVGVMNVNDTRPHHFSERDIALVSAIADQVGTAIERAQLYESLREQSIRDPLTGLHNRRYMEESLEREIHRAARRRLPLSLIMIDLDYFKQFNDTYKHAAGDVLLRELGNFLQHQIRAGDVACRYGGEEFLIILPDTTAEVAQERAEKLRREVKKLRVQFRNRLLGPISLSLGIALFPEHGKSGRAVIHAADEALYQAKAQGRDQVVLYDPLSTPARETPPDSDSMP